MHDNFALILTLTGAFTAALILGYATYRVGLSPIVGYLLAGIVVGPNTPGFVADTKLANELAEVGVILLMFGVGLHFHVKDLLAVRRVAVPGALGQILVTTLVAGSRRNGVRRKSLRGTRVRPGDFRRQHGRSAPRAGRP